MTQTIELDELEDKLKTLTASAEHRDLSYFLQVQIKDIADLHQQYFASQSGPSGAAWEPWHWTPAWAPKDHPTLEITGRLRSSLVPGGHDNIAAVTGDELTFGTSVSYASLLNYGGDVAISEALVSRDGKGSIPAGTLISVPAREFVGLNEDYVGKMVNNLADELMDDILKGL